MFLVFFFSLFLSVPFFRTHVNQLNPQAERCITNILSAKTPYLRENNGCLFLVDNPNCYPPGSLSEMFASYLIKENLVNNNVVADIGCASCALGIVAAKNGATKVLGVDINPEALICAQKNAVINKINPEVLELFLGDGVSVINQDYKGKIDLIVAGAPWDSISLDIFEALPEDRKSMCRAFYDVEDSLMRSVMRDGFGFLSAKGRILVTSSDWALPRLKELGSSFGVSCKVVSESLPHKDGSLDFIVELIKT